MKELLTNASAITVLLAIAAFLFAVVMQPIFVWIICARLKKTNDLLRRIEMKGTSPHRALR